MRKRLKWVYFVLGLIILFSQIYFLRYWYYKTLDDIGLNAMSISRTVAQNIDLDQYEEIVLTKERNDYFYQMQDFFKKVQESNGIKYLYVEHQLSSEEIEYIFDAEKDSLGDREESSTPEAHSSLESMHTKVQTFTLYGSLISGYTPLVKNGEILGVVGADIDVALFYGELRTRLIGIALYALFMILIFSLLIYLNFKEELKIRRSSEQHLKRMMTSIQNLLDNAGQGFLRFGDDLKINKEYSKECIRLFDTDPSDQDFPALIYPDDSEQQEFLAKLLKEILSETNSERRQIFTSLLPTEVWLNNRLLNFDFRLIKDPHHNLDAFLVVITDRTDKKLLEDQMEAERKTLQMIVHAVTKKDELIESIQAFQNLNIYAHQVLKTSKPVKDILSELFRTIHTFKGTFAQYDMSNLVNSLHDLESELSAKLGNPQFTRLELVKFWDECPFMEWLEKDLSILRSSLGNQFLNRKTISVEEEKLNAIKHKVRILVQEEAARELLADLERLRYKPFSDLLIGYPNYVKILAQRVDKSIHPLTIVGDEILVDPTFLNSFTRSLTHVFRNAIEHGIEPPEDRLELGKEERGQISCHFKKADSTIVLQIRDDGQGMDSCTLEKVFEMGFSTKPKVTELSGRGVGLPSVKNELEKIGGQLSVYSVPGEGTTFEFFIPYNGCFNSSL